MINNFSGGRTKIKWRGDMLVAWFAEATPPVLWRWQASDVSAGFGLKKEDGRAELVKHEATTGSTLIAAFPNEAKAQMALAMLSDAMMIGSSTSTGYPPSRSLIGLIWKWISSVVLAILLLYFAYVATRILIFFNDPVGSVMRTTSAASSAAEPQPQPQAARPQQPVASSLPFPFAPVPQHPAAAPVEQGKPVDADSLFH